ncbi:MAG: hypothetical protein ACKOVH_10360 [Actinomycetota bacterium]
MANDDSGTDPVERALRMLVYGPVGLACYVKDSAPTFLGLFVSRGQREVANVRRTVGERLGIVTPEPATPRADPLGTIGRAATQAGAAAATTVTPVVKAGIDAATSALRSVTGSPSSGAPSTAAPSTAAPSTAAPPAGGAPTGEGGSATDLPIPGYDGLSASQVIERLGGLPASALAQIRAYEAAHRGRRTVLASIDQLTD